MKNTTVRPRTPIMLLVLTRHRYGTSLTTRMLECLGARNSSNPLRTLHDADLNEWAYSEVKPAIVAEHLIGTRDEGLIDINIRCADGEPIVASLIQHNKSPRKQAGYYDIEGRRLSPSQGPNPAACFGELPADFPVPGVFHQAAGHARELSRGVDYAHFDFMTDGRDLFGGEITVYPASGHSQATTGDGFGIDKLVMNTGTLAKAGS